MDDATLLLLRESSGLRLDAEGAWWHEHDRLEHARTVAALHRGLHRAPDGRFYFSVFNPEFGKQMAIARKGMRSYRNTLRALAE